jgi:lipopolysaccharide export system permease protein
MKTLRRLIYLEILVAVGFVLLSFVSLFVFFDLVDELPALGKAAAGSAESVYKLRHAFAYVVLLVPNRLYELMPIAVLIGSVFVLTRFAQSSEYTILRTSGLGPWRALRTLLALGAGFVVLTFVLGDYLAPYADRQAQMLKAHFQGRISVGQTGAWLREKQATNLFSVNVGALDANSRLRDIRLFRFNAQGQIDATLQAESGDIGPGDQWQLHNVLMRDMTGNHQTPPRIEQVRLHEFTWPTTLTAEMVSVALLNPERMRTLDLFNYINHLEANNQTAQRYEIEFWRKVFYPLSCLVMVVLALPFAYLHFRSGGVAGYVFLGVMIGISFFLLNNVFGYIGNLRAWEPWLAAASPALLYTVASLGAFGWLVLRR